MAPGLSIIAIYEATEEADKMPDIDYARCGYGHLTPIQPSTPDSAEAYRRSIETGIAPLHVACKECNRVYKAPILHSFPSEHGLLPYHAEAQLLVFQEPIECDGGQHSFRLLVTGVRNVNTSAADVVKNWVWGHNEEMRCSEEHEIPLPPYR
jgi:hypothetical protein